MSQARDQNKSDEGNGHLFKRGQRVIFHYSKKNPHVTSMNAFDTMTGTIRRLAVSYGTNTLIYLIEFPPSERVDNWWYSREDALQLATNIKITMRRK